MKNKKMKNNNKKKLNARDWFLYVIAELAFVG